MRDPAAPVPAPIARPLNWGRSRDAEAEARVRRWSAGTIMAAIAHFETIRVSGCAHPQCAPRRFPTTCVHLAIGEACALGSLWEKNFIHSIVTVSQWNLFLRYAEMRREIESEYSPEVIALAHVKLERPPSVLPLACFMTLVAALLWWCVIRSAEE